ncbi:dynactin subunit 6 isoform X2 [Anabrus simplex]|uniref:dynactin subunit 6 isoform X2 n=1 Tax=Anabrus simplex TaxID=316456 RepID=UPI0034DCD149
MTIVVTAVVFFLVSVKIAPGAAEMRGDVTIGSNNVIHPQSIIIAEAGPIVIGSNNVIQERAVIINRQPQVLRIGHNNVFKVDSHSEALRFGNNNVLEPRCFVGSAVEVTDNNVVSAGCRLTCPEVVGPNAVTCGHQCTWSQQEYRPPFVDLQFRPEASFQTWR